MYNPTSVKGKELDNQKIQSLKKHYGDFVLMIARCEEGKGLDIAIEAMKELKVLGIERNILFAGDGTLLNKIKEYAKKVGMDNQCVFLGNCFDVQNYIAASYINLLTSLWEGLPTVIVEAMTLGKPCVMTNSDDGEVSQGGKYCILEDINDYRSIAKDLFKLYTDSEYYNKYVELSLERAKYFDPEVIKGQLEYILR